ncbi:MAG: hypothetical protein WD078_09255 [Woeseia sp.]
MAKLRDKVAEFAAIAADLPENLQVVCFELLLHDHLDRSRPQPSAQLDQRREASKRKDDDPKTEDKAKTVEEAAKAQADIVQPDLHVKAKRFLEKYSITLDHLNNVFYKEDGNILPLYEDLKTTKMSEAQIRIAMLQSLKRAISTGTFEASVEEVREECNDRKCNDKPNFAATFRNNNAKFDFDTFDRSTKTVRLSEDGRAELALVLKELQ